MQLSTLLETIQRLREADAGNKRLTSAEYKAYKNKVSADFVTTADLKNGQDDVDVFVNVIGGKRTPAGGRSAPSDVDAKGAVEDVKFQIIGYGVYNEDDDTYSIKNGAPALTDASEERIANLAAKRVK